jgi:adsorption protein B
MPIDPDTLIDWATGYLFGLRLATAAVGTVLAVLGSEDLLIDLLYWARRLWRRLTVYSRHRFADEQLLYQQHERPLAILVPAWNEVGVVGEMARLAASRLDYENYQIFVGTYPNDPDTQADVDEACSRFSNVHKVVCALPGPTSKADCLNNIIAAVFAFEREASVSFSGFILHDAEDVISPLELRLFNLLVDRKDLIQVPVYPFLHRHWWNFTANHYADEFAELHGKDVLVREALVGQVPSAGVGTCFSRRAILRLLDEGEGIAFSTQSLTEDYDIGIRLRQVGMAEIFVRFSPRDPALAPLRERRFGVNRRDSQVICVRENFPDTLATAVRQKSRWITGIVFQGARTLPWSSSPLLNYFLWRDRRGGISNLIGLISMLLAVQLGLVWLITQEQWSGWDYPSVLGDSRYLQLVLAYNGLLLLNRMVQRVYFTGSYYGLVPALMAVPRMVWSNWINFFANLRAYRQVMALGDARRVAWDKTTHVFPSVAETRRSQPLGQILIAQGALNQEQLEAGLQRSGRRRLGRTLLDEGVISSGQLAAALAEQQNLEWRDLDPFDLDPHQVAGFPQRLAYKYSVLPLSTEGDTLVLGRESPASAVALGVISRQIDRPCRQVLVPQGRIQAGLGHWYRPDEPTPMAAGIRRLAGLHSSRPDLLEQVCRQLVLLGDLALDLGLLNQSVLNQALISFEPERQRLGEHLVQQGLLSPSNLEQLLAEQARLRSRGLAALEVA